MGHSDPTGANSNLEQRLGLALMFFAGLALALWVLRLLLPWLGLTALGLLTYGAWRRRQRRQQALHQLFYDLLQRQQGHISVLDLAMAAGLTGTQARAFLDERAREFHGDFAPTDHGDVVYVFAVAGSATAPAEQPPVEPPHSRTVEASYSVEEEQPLPPLLGEPDPDLP